MVITLAAPLGVGKAADAMLPIEALSAALAKADAWVEFNEQWLLYSTPFERAFEQNKKLRYLCLVGIERGYDGAFDWKGGCAAAFRIFT